MVIIAIGFATNSSSPDHGSAPTSATHEGATISADPIDAVSIDNSPTSSSSVDYLNGSLATKDSTGSSFTNCPNGSTLTPAILDNDAPSLTLITRKYKL